MCVSDVARRRKPQTFRSGASACHQRGAVAESLVRAKDGAILSHQIPSCKPDIPPTVEARDTSWPGKEAYPPKTKGFRRADPAQRGVEPMTPPETGRLYSPHPRRPRPYYHGGAGGLASDSRKTRHLIGSWLLSKPVRAYCGAGVRVTGL